MRIFILFFELDFFFLFLDLSTTQNIGLFYMVIGVPLVAIAFIKMLDYKTWGIMKMTVKSFKKDTDVENYVLILIELIENKG